MEQDDLMTRGEWPQRAESKDKIIKGERRGVYNSCNKSMGWHCIGTDWVFLGCFC